MEAAVSVVTRRDIEAAAGRISSRVRVTPVVDLEPGAFGVPARVSLKLELMQHTGSFKPRGAFNRVLSSGVPAAGLVAASGGNHGLAVAHVARELGVPAEVFVPTSSSAVKVSRLRHYGAQITVIGEYYADAYTASERRAAETGALVVHAYDQSEVVAGQGTVGAELDCQLPGLDTVLVAVGGGGLLGGIATWFNGQARVVAVEPERIPTLAAALDAGHPVDVKVGGIAADSLGARRIGEVGLWAAQDAHVQSVLVSDQAIVAARQRLWDEMRVAAEAGGATALAALTCGAYRPMPGERVAVIVCGGNTNPADLIAEA
ncbi:MAG: threonine/serine dehydratase [Actinomycetota bacterium]|nr:threonine/serine dehydratase [Actinomycetota bacterium]